MRIQQSSLVRAAILPMAIGYPFLIPDQASGQMVTSSGPKIGMKQLNFSTNRRPTIGVT